MATRRAQLLEPERWDRMPLLGAGRSAQVRGHGRWAVKIAHPGERPRTQLADEVAQLRALAASPLASLRVPKLYETDPGGRAFIRDRVALPDLLALLRARDGVPDDAWLAPLCAALAGVERYAADTGVRLDFSPPNLFWDASASALWLVDLGPRAAPPVFEGERTEEEMRAALARYLVWRRRVSPARRPRPLCLPPSGRFHVDTAVGPNPSARLLWRNDVALRRHGLRWSDGELLGLCNVDTEAERRGHLLPATRYQDSPGTGVGHAQGDGRLVFVGEVPEVGLELGVKGCGPTPLSWVGNRFHEDGRVSFNRTLWEASVCDELARLGFDTSEVLAICSTSASTTDNTEVEWPAAAALRATRTHYRLGHLSRVAGDADAAFAMCLEMGRKTLRPDFDPAKVTHLRALVDTFATNLGRDVGGTDALNIHCFNPTMGNVRIDGHPIDFSTVRFLRWYLPDFIYMNETRRIAEHRTSLRKSLVVLMTSLRRAHLVTGEVGARMHKRAERRFDEAYRTGFLTAFLHRLGAPFPDSAVDAFSPARATRLLDAIRAFRRARAKDHVQLAFWKQTCRAPRFDLEGRLPAFVDALRAGRAEPWSEALTGFAGSVGKRAKRTAEVLTAQLGRALHDLNEARVPISPRRWDEVIRPFMEAEQLADLCYRRTTVERMGAWRRHLASSRALDAGRWAPSAARVQAAARGHVRLAGVRARRYERVVGLGPEVLGGIQRLVDDLLDDTHVGTVAFGPRVGGGADHDQPVVETPVGTGATPLRLVTFVRANDDAPDRVADALTRALDRLGAPFPFDHALVVVSGEGDLAEACHALVEAEGEPRELDALVVVATPDMPADPAAEVMRCLAHVEAGPGRAAVAVDTLVVAERPLADAAPAAPGLDERQLTLCLEDNATLQPWPLPARRVDDGRVDLLCPDAALVLAAARAAGRARLVVELSSGSAVGR